MKRKFFLGMIVIFFGVVAVGADRTELKLTEADVVPIFGYLQKYWGPEYARNVARYLAPAKDGSRVISMIPRWRIEELWNQATNNRHKDRGKIVRGFVHGDRVFVVFDEASAFAKGATIVHELLHYQKASAGQQVEIDAIEEAEGKRTFLSYAERNFGIDWLAEVTEAVRGASALRWTRGRSYYTPTKKAVRILATKLVEKGVEEKNEGILASYAVTLANSQDQLVLWLLETGYLLE